jgi:transcriptional regulator with XRE-family HTH domain
MKFQQLLDRIANQDRSTRLGGMVTPTSEVIAFNVRCLRALRQLKKRALAHMAGVSLSTIERVERAEKVSDESLDKIAVALGQEPGYYTAPRRRRSAQEMVKELKEEYGELQEVQVRPLRTQVQVRELGCCHGYLINRPGLDETFDNDIGALAEWLDLASSVLRDLTYGGDGAEGRRRELYKSVLEAVAGLEARGVTVLAGTMAGPQPGITDWKIAVLSITRKDTDPGAIKRQSICVDHRCTRMHNGWR